MNLELSELPSGPDADAPLRISLAEFARMMAVLNTGDRSLEKLFAAFGIDEADWQAITAHWMRLIARDGRLGDQFSALLRQEISRLLDAYSR